MTTKEEGGKKKKKFFSSLFFLFDYRLFIFSSYSLLTIHYSLLLFFTPRLHHYDRYTALSTTTSHLLGPEEAAGGHCLL